MCCNVIHEWCATADKQSGILFFKPGVRRPAAGARLVYLNHFDADVGMCVWYVSVCPPPRLLETSGVM